MRKIICFHNPDEINGFLSNWYPSRFKDENGIFYSFMEQYMMYQKAILFHDYDNAEKIMNAGAEKIFSEMQLHRQEMLFWRV